MLLVFEEKFWMPQQNVEYNVLANDLKRKFELLMFMKATAHSLYQLVANVFINLKQSACKHSDLQS